MGVQNVLNLGGVDVVAGGDDHPLGSAPEIHKALAVHGAEVAGADPGQAVGVVLQGFRGFLRMVHVLLHHRGACQKDFTFFTVGKLLLGAGLDDFDVGIGEGKTDAALLVHVAGGQAAGGDGLGGAVALPHLNGGFVVVQELVQLLFQLDGQGIAAGKNALQAAEVSALHIRQTEQRLIQGGNARDEVAALLDQILGVALGGEPGNQNAPAALGQHGVDAHAQTEAVEDGHGGQHLVPGTEHGVGGDDLLPQRVKVLIGQDDALGGAGGAAGVEDDGGIVGGAADLVVIEAIAAHPHEFLPADDRGVFGNFLDLPPLCEHVTGLDGLRQRILDAGDDDVDHLGVLADGLEFIVELIEGDGGDAFGFVEIELNFLLSGQGMHHVGNAAHQIDGVEQVNGLRAVGHGDGDLVALPDANGFQCLGTGLHLLHQLLVGGGLAHEVKGNVIGVFFGNGLHSLKHGAFKIVKVHGHTAHGASPWGLCGDCFHQ